MKLLFDVNSNKTLLPSAFHVNNCSWKNLNYIVESFELNVEGSCSFEYMTLKLFAIFLNYNKAIRKLQPLVINIQRCNIFFINYAIVFKCTSPLILRTANRNQCV